MLEIHCIYKAESQESLITWNGCNASDPLGSNYIYITSVLARINMMTLIFGKRKTLCGSDNCKSVNWERIKK